MAGSRGNERKCPRRRRLKSDTALCLSDLPDEILLHILSFLPTKSAVATSVLSKRWEYLWISTPNLQLHNSLDFRHVDQFMNFAERALVLRAGSSLVSFSLKCSVENDASRINTWITSAIRYNVEQLTLFLFRENDGHPFFLPSCVFGCQSLVKLELSMSRSIIRVPSLVCLPRLKHLTLKYVEFEDNESAEKLLSHPSLEELIISYCTWGGVTFVNVNSPKLQFLAITNDDEDDEVEDWSEERQVCFIGDNLKFFHYEGDLPPTQYCICGSTMQLSEAKIAVGMVSIGHNFQYMDGLSNRYCKLVNQLSMVQTLTLMDRAGQSFYLLSQCPWLQTKFPVFERVTRLNLNDGYDPDPIDIDSKWLTMLYERCPQLEHLNFMQLITLECLTEDTPILTPMPACFRTHLKEVTFQNYNYPASGKSCYQYPINLLFNSAAVLEEVVIYEKMDDRIPDQVSSVEEFERELNSRPKVSEKCRVSIELV